MFIALTIRKEKNIIKAIPKIIFFILSSPYLVPLIAKINIAIVNPAPIAASAIATSGACKI